ncbi:MAG: hypothetical protein NC345_14145 [Lachnospira sp.]|nr:hypothetical protein [Lachnospira sp.]
MTEIDLLDALAEESREALKGFRLRSAKENLIPINIYTQNLPVKKEKGDESLYPYVRVCFDEEEIASRDDSLVVYVYFIIGVKDTETDKQGFRDVLQIANTIYQHIFRKGIIANMFRPDYPFKIALQEDDTYPFFIGGIESKWELPVIGEEEKYI